jgi:aspartyl-tRNA(Asn)/glutamyl-tRNA(Gln) amidotransferase subunit C
MDSKIILKTASLARLHLSETEAQKFAVQVGDILKYVEKLNELDTSTIVPMTHAFEYETPLREDELKKSLGAEKLLHSAPEHLYETYKVPQVLGGGSGA